MKENSYELALIELFTQDLGYQHEFGGDIERDFDDPLYSEVLLDSLMRLNPKLDSTYHQLAIEALRSIDSGSLVIRNRTFMDYLQNGIPVTTFDRGESHTELVRLLDTKVFDNNDFRIINQWTFCERGC